MDSRVAAGSDFGVKTLAHISLVAATLCACAPPLVNVAPSAAEVKAHRLFQTQPLRLETSCAKPGFPDEFMEKLDLSLKINSEGAPRLTDLRLTDTLGREWSLALDRNGQPAVSPDAVPVTQTCLSAVRAVAEHWRYRPFEADHRRAEASIVETVFAIPAERWQTPRQAFPAIADPHAVHISLQRGVGLIVCAGHTLGYAVDLAGDGGFSITTWKGSGRPGSHITESVVARGAVAADVAARLIDRFRAADFFSLRREYISGWTDQSGFSLRLSVGDQNAAVQSYVGETVGMPLSVAALADAVDAAVDSAHWVGPLQCFQPSVLRSFYASLR